MRFEEGSGALLPRGTEESGRLLYLHVPFCESLCTYCSFNRVLFDESLCRHYFAALRKEMSLYREKGYNFQGIYVGGGTPTVLMDELEETLSHARVSFKIREISVETNPNHLTGENLEVLRRAGVNRLSVGIQSFDDGLLKAMGRYNSYGSGSEIRERLINAKGYFDTLNADMIFNFPLQTGETLERDIDILRETEVDQVTYYPLMVSDSTRSAVERTLGRVDYTKERDFYRLISGRLTPHYRFSSAWCFSRKDAIIDEYIVDYDDYAGLGSGSIGYLDGRCYANTFYIPEYIERLERGELPLMASRDFSLQDRIRYDFVMKLFGMDLSLDSLAEKYGRRTFVYLFPDIAAFLCAGGLRYSEGALHLTGRGRYYWVIMMREFFTAVNNFRDFCLNARGV
ncbi:MAG: coproporphyrinogen III oxidase family protein [Deltaproteobacteria bacterium]|nr:coproporphyrinogen III oxidase family protein [Deltaproteobacteria bacterium]MBN2846119.1 coproporphyrinogen III oxidase family protein [Deltaproteobacteria bacterium]